MFYRLLILLTAMLSLCSPALAGSRNDHLVPQQGSYAPAYSPAYTYAIPVGEPFELTIYEDDGTLPMQAEHNGGLIPAGASLCTDAALGSRRRCALIRGTILTEGSYAFSVVIREANGAEMNTLAILQVTLRVSSDVETVDKYLGDGQGMLRVAMNGVNFRRTPGGTRLGTCDENARLVWCSTQEKGGYTWYRVWSAEYGYGYVRGDTVQVEPPRRLVYTPGKDTAYALFITADNVRPLTPGLIMTQAPEEIGFDTDALVTIVRGNDTWTMLCFCIEEEKSFWIHADLRDEYGVPLECQLVYLTPRWEEMPDFTYQ